MKSKHYAYTFSALYVVLLAVVFYFGKIDIRPKEHLDNDVIYLVEEVKPEPPPEPKPQPKPQPKPTPTVPRDREAPQHEQLSNKDNSQQVTGKDEETRTVNERALFKMAKGGEDKPVDGGNKYAKQDTVAKASGTGGGLNVVGNSELDEGLQGRGLVGSLPKPKFPGGNRGGTVVVRVAVNEKGVVTEATYEPKGSTTSDNVLVTAAIKAAKQTRFTESKAFIQGGRITYRFILK